jgi:hypothetical protein
MKADANSDFEKYIDLYAYYVGKRTEEYFKESGFTRLVMPTIEVSKGGKRFVKVFKTEYAADGVKVHSKSIHSFVEKATGNVYKAASYKAPELNHVRANIYDYESLRKGVSHHGANYM